MLIKQITAEEAFKLFLKGKEVKMLVPNGYGTDNWEDICPTTLQKVLSGSMFFEQEEPIDDVPLVQAKELIPSAEVPVPYPEVPQMVDVMDQKEKKPAERENTRKKIDTGRILALSNAGWGIKKIADDMHLTPKQVSSNLYLARRKVASNETRES